MSSFPSTPSAATVAQIADYIIWPITGRDTRDCDRLDNGNYRLSDGVDDTEQAVTPDHILAGTYGWAAMTLTSHSDRDPDNTEVARAIVTGRWADAADLLHARNCDAGVDIWDYINQIGMEAYAPDAE